MTAAAPWWRRACFAAGDEDEEEEEQPSSSRRGCGGRRRAGRGRRSSTRAGAAGGPEGGGVGYGGGGAPPPSPPATSRASAFASWRVGGECEREGGKGMKNMCYVVVVCMGGLCGDFFFFAMLHRQMHTEFCTPKLWILNCVYRVFFPREGYFFTHPLHPIRYMQLF